MKKREHNQPISEVRFMITQRSVADFRRLLSSLPVTLLSLVVAACVLITPVSALAQTNDAPYGEPEKVCYRMIKRTDEQIVLSFNPYCDLRRLAYAFPIRDEDGKAISVQKYLQSLYAVNGRFRTDGLKSSVKGGCVRPGKPSPDATPGELAACPDGLMNYYATPSDDSMATIIVPSARQLTYEEKLNKRIKELEKENAELKQGKPAEPPAASQPDAAKPTAAAPAAKPADNGPEMASVKADNDKLRAENVSLINWTYLLASTIFLLLAMLCVTLFMWWRADKKRPVKRVRVFDQTAWDKREKKLTEALQSTMDAKVAEIRTLQSERDEAVQKSVTLGQEMAEKTKELQVVRASVASKDKEIATLTEERDKVVQTIGALQSDLSQKTKELQEERDSKDPAQQDVDVQQMARDLMACKLRTHRLSEEKAGLTGQLETVRTFADQLADANRICNAQLTDVQSELTAVKQERDQAQGQVKSLGEQLAAKQQELQGATSALEAFKADAASAIRGKEQAERQIDSLQAQLATVSQPEAQSSQPSDGVSSASGDSAQDQTTIQELELQVRTLSSDKVELEGKLVAMTERAKGAEQTIRDFQSSFGHSSQPPSAKNLSAVTPPDQSLAPEGAKGGTDYSTETRDRDATVQNSAVASGSGSENSDPHDTEINAAEREAAVQVAVVLEQLREYLSQNLRAKEARDNLLSRINYLSTVSEETEREVLDHDGDAKVVSEGRAKIKRVRDHIAKLREDLVEANGQLSKLKKFGREACFCEFAFSQPEENPDKRIERLVGACRQKAFDDLHDPSSPIYNCLPVTQDKKEHEEFEVLLEAVKRANSMLGEDPQKSKNMDAPQLAVSICTRAMTVMGKASSDSQSFDTAKQRVEQVESTLAEEREKCATERTKAFRLANECEDLRQEVSTLKNEKESLETRLANVLENYQRDATRAREEHEKIKERGRTPESRLALANLRVAEADQRAAEARYASDAMRQDNQVVQGVVQRLLGLLVSNTGEPVDLHDQKVAAELQRLNDSLRKVSSRLNLRPNPVPESPSESRMQMRAVSKVSSPEVRTALENRLSKAEWGEVQYLAKLMMRETVMRRKQHAGNVFMVDTTEELFMLHDFLHMPVECGRQVDREYTVQVPVPQLYHLSDPRCAEPTNGSSGMLSSPGTMRPSSQEQPVPPELGDLLPRSSNG